ncbi:hypothetical protein A0J61_10692, partial [Choanephora cucurbitarum]
LDALVQKWVGFLHDNMPPTASNVNMHYLTHLTQWLKAYHLHQINCKPLERRIQRMKRMIKSTSNTMRNAENVMIDEVYRNFQIRSTINYNKPIDAEKDMRPQFTLKKCLYDFRSVDLSEHLSKHKHVTQNRLVTDILVAKTVEVAKSRKFESSLVKDKRKSHLSCYALVQREGQTKPAIAEILLLFRNEDINYALVHFYQAVKVSDAGIPFCNGNDFANSDISSRNAVLEVVSLEALLVPIAMLQSNTNLDKYFGRMYFFWSNMSRTAVPIEDYRFSFNFEDDNYSACDDNA